MIKEFDLKHLLQRHIIDVLKYQEFARFSELILPKTDTNVFSYHLKTLLEAGLIKKVDDTYTLSQKSFLYIENLTKNVPTNSTKIVCMLLIQNSEGDILLWRRHKQPYINRWTLPYSKLTSTDSSIAAAGERVAHEKLGLSNQPVVHAGEVYVRICEGNELKATTLVHVLRFNRDNINTSDSLQWVQPHKLSHMKLAPAVEEIVARSFFGDDFFFEEYDIDYVY